MSEFAQERDVHLVRLATPLPCSTWRGQSNSTCGNDAFGAYAWPHPRIHCTGRCQVCGRFSRCVKRAQRPPRWCMATHRERLETLRLSIGFPLDNSSELIYNGYIRRRNEQPSQSPEGARGTNDENTTMDYRAGII